MSATTSVDHEWTHDESTNRSAEKHTKMGDFGDTEKVVFLERSAEEGKMGERVGARRRAWSEKIFRRQAWRGGVGRIQIYE